MTRFVRSRLWLILFAVVVAWACKSNSVSKSKAPAPGFRLQVAQGGGVTGLVSGYTLYSDGSVEHWQRYPGQSDSTMWRGRIASESVRELQAALEKSDALALRLNQPGNMTTYVSYARADTTFKWVSGDGEKGFPKEIQAWIENVRKLCHDAEMKAKRQ